MHSDIEVDYFQGKIAVDNEVAGLNVPVTDKQLVEIRDALDEAPADLSDLPMKSATCERDHFWKDDPQCRLCLEPLV